MNRNGSIVLHAVLLMLFVSAFLSENLCAAAFPADSRIHPGLYCSSSIGMIREPAEQISDCPYTAAVSNPEEQVQLVELYHHGEKLYSREVILRENGNAKTVRTIYPEKTIEEQYDEQGRMIREMTIDVHGTEEIHYTYDEGLLVQAESYIDEAAAWEFTITRDTEKALRILQEDYAGEDTAMRFLMLSSETAAAGTSESFYLWKEKGRSEIQEKWENGICMQTVITSFSGDSEKRTETRTSSGRKTIQITENGKLISEEISSPGHHETAEYRYTSSGKLAEIQKLVDGRRSSVVFSYNSADELLEKKLYEDGVITKNEIYADGTLIKTEIYSNGRLVISREHENN